MRSLVLMFVVAVAALPGSALSQVTFSTGAVDLYSPCNVGPDLPNTIPEADSVALWFSLAGFPSVSRWTNGNVWGSDFRDGTDIDPGGGSDAPRIYFYSGHGICQNPPKATDGDFITVCGKFGKPDTTTIGTSTRWGNGTGRLQFGLLDASCPMDLVSLSNQWFPVLTGVHVATGHSGTSTSDTLDSVSRGSDFAALIASPAIFWFFPHLSVGDAWMTTGIEDVQPGCCAVVIAGGSNRDDAIDRRDHERLTDGRPNPVTTWAAWRWICN